MRQRVTTVHNLDPAKVLRKAMEVRDYSDFNVGVVWEHKIHSSMEFETTSEEKLRAFIIEQVLIDEMNLRSRTIVRKNELGESQRRDLPSESLRKQLKDLPSEKLALVLVRISGINERSVGSAHAAEEVYLLPLEIDMLKDISIVRA